MQKPPFRELGSLFFTARQIIRDKVPAKGKPDPNEWLRLETLRYISQERNPTMHDIAKYLHITAPSTTSLTKNLEKLEMISRKHSNIDKRIVRIRLTPKGRRTLTAYAKHSESIMRTVFGQLPRQDVEKLRQILRQLKSLHG